MYCPTVALFVCLRTVQYQQTSRAIIVLYYVDWDLGFLLYSTLMLLFIFKVRYCIEWDLGFYALAYVTIYFQVGLFSRARGGSTAASRRLFSDDMYS